MHRSICTRDVPVWPSYFVPTQLCARWIPENKVERDQFLFSPAAGPAGSTGAGPPFAAISEAIRALSGAQPHWVGAYRPLQPRCFLLLSLLFDRTLMMAHSTIMILTMGPSTIATSLWCHHWWWCCQRLCRWWWCQKWLCYRWFIEDGSVNGLKLWGLQLHGHLWQYSNGSTSNNMASDGTDFNVGDSNFGASNYLPLTTQRGIFPNIQSNQQELGETQQSIYVRNIERGCVLFFSQQQFLQSVVAFGFVGSVVCIQWKTYNKPGSTCGNFNCGGKKE